ncbi:hypothetical protein pb186bvf_020273 [Paramecium bursaria]
MKQPDIQDREISTIVHLNIQEGLSDQKENLHAQEQMKLQVIQFLDQNVQNLQRIILEKDQEIQLKDSIILEKQILIIQMYNQFEKLQLTLETDKDDVLSRYYQIVDQFQNQLVNHQPQVIQNNDQELIDAKSQLHQYMQEVFRLQVRMKELEINIQQEQKRAFEQQSKIEYLEQQLISQKKLNSQLETQIQDMMLHFEQFKQLQIKEYQIKEQQIVKEQQMSFYESKQPQAQNDQKTYQYFENQRSHTENQVSQPKIKVQTGILNFPSEQRYYQSMAEEEALSKQLNELTQRKQQIESELSKRITNSKSIHDRKRRESQEQEIDQLSENISKIKLKLREIRQN